MLVLLALAGAAFAPVSSALAVMTSSASVPANTLGAASAFPRCYGDAVLTDNPIGYWRLDETTGTAAADSKGTNTGTYTNGVTVGQPGALPDSVNNRAATFDGADDYVALGNAASVQLTTGTIEAWIKTSNAGAGPRDIINKHGAYAVYLQNNVLSVYDWGTSTEYSTGVNLADNAWHHVAVTFQSGVAGGTLIYADGQLRGTATITVATQTYPLQIGNENGSVEYFAGTIDEAAVYGGVLTAAQLRAHYNTGRCYKDAVLADNPVGYWRLGESSGTTAADGVAGRHGTYLGSPTLAQAGAPNLDSNTAASFNGTNQYVRVPYSSTLNPSSFTVEAWAKPTGGSQYRSVVSSLQDTGGGSWRGFWLGVNPSNAWEGEVGQTGGAVTQLVGPAVSTGTWVHLALTYDGTTAKLYVDGLLVASLATSYRQSVSVPLTVGTGMYDASTASELFPGSVDEVAVYGTALSASRIQAHYLIGRSYKDTVLDSGPVSYWRLGEASGTSATDTKGTNTGTYTNGAVLAQVGAIAGDADTSVSFDGVDDYVDVPYTAGLNPAQFTLEAWAEVTSGSGTWRLVASSWTHPSDFQGYWVGVDTQDRWTAHMGNGVIPEVNADGPTVTLNTWTHLAETYDGTTLRLYVNGALAAGLATTTYTQNTSPTAFEIGAEYYNAARRSFFPGSIDDVAVYSRALSGAEVQLHYDSGRQ